MLIKNLAVVMGAISAFPAFAQATAQDAYVSAVIGSVSVGALVLVVGIYKLAQFAFVKLKTVGHAHVPQAAGKAMEVVSSHFRQVTVTPVKVVDPSEDCWSAALSEFESGDRRPGLWAKALSDGTGNEALAKSAYLRVRANELHLAAEVHRQQQQQEVERQRAAIAYTQLSNESNDSQVIEACEAQLQAIGVEVRRLNPDKWEICREGTSFAYSVKDLRKLTDAFTAVDLRKRAAVRSAEATCNSRGSDRAA